MGSVFQASSQGRLNECTACNGLLEVCGSLDYLDQQEKLASERIFACVHRHHAFQPWKLVDR